MKNKIWIYLIVVVLMVATYFGFKNNVKKEQTDETNLMTEETIVNAPNKTVDYKGNYYELMLEKSKTKMNNKKYIIYKGWTKYIDDDDDHIYVDIEYWGDDVVDDKTGERYDVIYSGIMAEKENVFIIDNDNEKLATIDDLLKLENEQYINFSALCEEETESFGWLGQVAKACPTGPTEIICEKISFTEPFKGQRVNFKTNGFEDNNQNGILPIENQNMNITSFVAIEGEKTVTKKLIPIGVIDDKEVWIKINNFDDKVLADEDISYESKDYYLVNDYDVSGATICSTFNEFCFISIDKIIMNSKVKLKDNNDIGVENFQYQVYKKSRDGDLDVTLNQNGEFLLQEGNDIYINISDYISENDYLDKMTNDWGSYSLVDITPEDSDYSIKAFGDLNCGSINDLIRNGDLECILKPEDFSFQMTKPIVDDNE